MKNNAWGAVYVFSGILVIPGLLWGAAESLDKGIAGSSFNQAPSMFFSAQDPVPTFQAESRERPAAIGISVPPLHLNRSLTLLSNFSRLPESFQYTLKESYISHTDQSPVRLAAKEARLEHILPEMSRDLVTTEIRKVWVPGPVQLHTFAESTQVAETASQPSQSGWSVGAGTQAEILNIELGTRLSYEEQIAASVTSSGVTASLYSSMPLQRIFDNSELRVSWEYAAERAIHEEFQNAHAHRTPRGELYAPDIANISIVNVSLAMAPSSQFFMSVDYFHYVQDQLQKQSFSNNPSSFLVPEMTNGQSHDLGQELNFKAVFAHSESVISQLFAGWFHPGDAYRQADDKTFEIRGEIIVNF